MKNEYQFAVESLQLLKEHFEEQKQLFPETNYSSQLGSSKIFEEKNLDIQKYFRCCRILGLKADFCKNLPQYSNEEYIQREDGIVTAYCPLPKHDKNKISSQI